MKLIFRQLQDPVSSTYTYLLGDPVTREAVIIDPVFEQARRDMALLGELGLTLVLTLDTHVHADHVTGAWQLKRALGSRIGVARRSGAREMDLALEDGQQVRFGRRHLVALATPGHTNGCMTFVLDDRSMAFTGDALLIRGAGRTDFQEGSARLLYHSIVERLFTLPDDCLVYPGHDYRGLTCSSIGEEKAHNPRIGKGRDEGDFVGYMENLGLPHPRQINIAVPANLACGHTPAADAPPADAWAPLRYTYAGIHEIDPVWVAEHLREVRVIDVREPAEFDGMLGHIAGAELIPLGQLQERASKLDKDAATILACRSGARSAQAVTLLEKAGFRRVANLAGGMIAWNAQRLPVASPT